MIETVRGAGYRMTAQPLLQAKRVAGSANSSNHGLGGLSLAG